MSKITSLEQAVQTVQNGSVVALGGNVLHRAPMAAVYELARQKKENLRLIKTAGAMDVDLLCFAGCVQSVDAGFISYETEFGLAQHYRKAVQSGTVTGNEHACYTVISALRAASVGVDFMPVRGLVNSDLLEKNSYFSQVRSPFNGGLTTVVQAIKPDVVFLHVQEADKQGNARIFDPQYEDVLLSRTGAKVIITAEKIMPDTYFSFAQNKADIPHFLVHAVVHKPRGAFPCSCNGCYDVDKKGVNAFKALQTEQDLDGYLQQTR